MKLIVIVTVGVPVIPKDMLECGWKARCWAFAFVFAFEWERRNESGDICVPFGAMEKPCCVCDGADWKTNGMAMGWFSWVRTGPDMIVFP